MTESLGEGISIPRRIIPDLLKDPNFVDAVMLWSDYKEFGAPYGGGYMEWPCQVYDVIKCFDALFQKYKVNDG